MIQLLVSRVYPRAGYTEGPADIVSREAETRSEADTRLVHGSFMPVSRGVQFLPSKPDQVSFSKSLTWPLIPALPETYTHSLKYLVLSHNSKGFGSLWWRAGTALALILLCDWCFDFSKVISPVYSSPHACLAVLSGSCCKGACQALRGALCKEDPSQGCVSCCHWHNFWGPIDSEDKGHSTHSAKEQNFQRDRNLKRSDYVKPGPWMCYRLRGKEAWDRGRNVHYQLRHNKKALTLCTHIHKSVFP